jgi:acyl carrier protein
MDDRLKETLAAELQTDPQSLTADTFLADLPSWDSVTMLSVMVMLGDATGQPVTPAELAALKTFGDIETLCAAKRGP